MTRSLRAATVWWDGHLYTGLGLRLDATGAATLTEPPADAEVLPGTLLPGLVDAHVHSGLVDLATVRAGGIAGVWDLGSVPDRVASLARRGAPLPRIRYAGPFLIAPGGYPSDRSWAAAGTAANATAIIV